MPIHVLDFARQSGFLAVAKTTTGDVVVTTTPATYLTDWAPQILATDRAGVDRVLKTTNVRDLVARKHLTVYAAPRFGGPHA